MKFEIISKYADTGLSLPVRKTTGSAGYDFQVAENTIVPSYIQEFNRIYGKYYQDRKNLVSLEQISEITKESNFRPTLVPTGIKCELPTNKYLELSVRSSCPLKHWLVLANGVGVIDSDYYNNPDNEGHIYFQIINLSPFDIMLHKGDTIGQGIIKHYYTVDNDAASGERVGGFGSTTPIIDLWNDMGFPYCVQLNNFTPLEDSKTFTVENYDVQYSST